MLSVHFGYFVYCIVSISGLEGIEIKHLLLMFFNQDIWLVSCWTSTRNTWISDFSASSFVTIPTKKGENTNITQDNFQELSFKRRKKAKMFVTQTQKKPHPNLPATLSTHYCHAYWFNYGNKLRGEVGSQAV